MTSKATAPWGWSSAKLTRGRLESRTEPGTLRLDGQVSDGNGPVGLEPTGVEWVEPATLFCGPLSGPTIVSAVRRDPPTRYKKDALPDLSSEARRVQPWPEIRRSVFRSIRNPEGGRVVPQGGVVSRTYIAVLLTAASGLAKC